MSDLEARLDALVRTTVVPALKPQGYAKRKLSWVRAGDGMAHWIILQRSHGNTPDHLRFYVEVAAYSAEFAAAVGGTVPDDLTKGVAQYRVRFEEVCDWPGQWVDLESWSDEDLARAFGVALEQLDTHLAAITDARSLAAAMAAGSSGLDLDLFAWSCANDDQAAIAEQLATAEANFGAEERWPRLRAQFDRVAQRFGVSLAAQ
ncbi:conserved hypothetical protein [Microbacterium sp. 8M]|uniref:DUF4304 domain-containing protein n=1 Tax=Microbacterium sp. 8M TaxID=2653153 RepID=UPI0012EF6030|nr:DUF4304 domain-containing protein [Microbacterium sp. 8M]VXB39447.1 conserved hypothetical protein [Microbacterium sp. 8M]